MGKKLYEVLVKDTVNDYIRGRISGILLATSKGYKHLYGYAHQLIHDGEGYTTVMRVYMTRWQCRKAQKIIEKHYPKTCVFTEDTYEKFFKGDWA